MGTLAKTTISEIQKEVEHGLVLDEDARYYYSFIS